MRALCLFVMKPAFALIIAVLLAAPANAQTRVRSTARTTAGIVAAVAGTGLIVGAFNYRRDCDEGYRSRYEGSYPNYSSFDYCTTFSERESFTQETPIAVNLRRPPLLYTGLAALTGGLLLATVWSHVDAPLGVTIDARPGRIRVSKTFSFEEGSAQ